MFENKYVLEASKNLKGNAFRVWIYIMFCQDDWDTNTLCRDLNLGVTAHENAFKTLRDQGYSNAVYKDGEYLHTEYHVRPMEQDQD